jgi:hypothetical protein
MSNAGSLILRHTLAPGLLNADYDIPDNQPMSSLILIAFSKE